MTNTTRANGKLIRKIAKLDRTWRLAGKPEGTTANKLAFELGNAYRRGMGPKARKAHNRSAARLNQRSGWENLPGC